MEGRAQHQEANDDRTVNQFEVMMAEVEATGPTEDGSQTPSQRLEGRLATAGRTPAGAFGLGINRDESEHRDSGVTLTQWA